MKWLHWLKLRNTLGSKSHARAPAVCLAASAMAADASTSGEASGVLASDGGTSCQNFWTSVAQSASSALPLADPAAVGGSGGGQQRRSDTDQTTSPANPQRHGPCQLKTMMRG